MKLYYRAWHAVMTLLFLAAVVRGGVLSARFGDLSGDPDGYREIADAVQGTKLFGRKYVVSRNPLVRWPLAETAYRPPLYPYALVAVAGDRALTPLRIALFHWALGVSSVLLTFYLAQAWGLTRSVAMLAALLVALDPILLRQSTQVMTETLAVFVALSALVALTRFARRPEPFEAMLVGVALAVCVLCRPTFIAFALLIIACVPLLRAPLVRRVTNLAVCCLTASLIVAPWPFRNYVDLGTPIVSTTHGGYTLALGNNVSFYEHLASGEAWQTPFDAEASRLRQDIRRARGRVTTSAHWEIENDRAAYLVAFDAIRDNPGMFGSSCVYRLWRFWSPLAMQLSPAESRPVRWVRYAAAFWYVTVFVLAIVGARRLGRQLFAVPWLWGMLLCLSFTVVHLFYWSDMRMRAPLMPIVAMLAAAGCHSIVAKARKRISQQSVSVGRDEISVQS
jgi:4-amino-4-deoxy-L-arabinose transferase-like glycosyltransferase